jgi:hypothetical protein
MAWHFRECMKWRIRRLATRTACGREAASVIVLWAVAVANAGCNRGAVGAAGGDTEAGGNDEAAGGCSCAQVVVE